MSIPVKKYTRRRLAAFVALAVLGQGPVRAMDNAEPTPDTSGNYSRHMQASIGFKDWFTLSAQYDVGHMKDALDIFKYHFEEINNKMKNKHLTSEQRNRLVSEKAHIRRLHLQGAQSLIASQNNRTSSSQSNTTPVFQEEPALDEAPRSPEYWQQVLSVNELSITLMESTLAEVSEPLLQENLRERIAILKAKKQSLDADIQANAPVISPAKQNWFKLSAAVNRAKQEEQEELKMVLGHAVYLRNRAISEQATLEQKYAYAHYLVEQRNNLKAAQQNGDWNNEIDNAAEQLLADLSLQNHPQAPYELLKLFKVQTFDNSPFHTDIQNVFFELWRFKKDTKAFALKESDRNAFLMHALLARYHPAVEVYNHEVQKHLKWVKSRSNKEQFLRDSKDKRVPCYDFGSLPHYLSIRKIAKDVNHPQRSTAKELQKSIERCYKKVGAKSSLDVLGTWFDLSDGSCSDTDESATSSLNEAQVSHTFSTLAYQESEARKMVEAKCKIEQEAEERRNTLDIYGLGKPGQLGFGVGVSKVIPVGFEPLDVEGTFDPTSDHYGNYRHIDTGGISVAVTVFAYRKGSDTSSELRENFSKNALEIKGLEEFNFNLIKKNCYSAREIQDALDAKGEGWILEPAFVNRDGIVRESFLTQKYIASPVGKTHLTSKPNTAPLSLTSSGCNTKSSDMEGCVGELGDAFRMAKATGMEQQVTSIFQYGALTKIALAQAQGIAVIKAKNPDADMHCAWWHKNAKKCSPRGANARYRLTDCSDELLHWESAHDGCDKPQTGSCSQSAKASHNGQASGVMDLNGCMWEVASGLTAFDNQLFVLKENVDIVELNRETAFDKTYYDEMVTPSHQTDILNSNQCLFPSDTTDRRSATVDALIWPKADDRADSTAAYAWTGFEHVCCYKSPSALLDCMMPLVGGSWNDASLAGVCARHWNHSAGHSSNRIGVRLSAYGPAWSIK